MDEELLLKYQKLQDELEAEKFIVSQIELLNDESFRSEGCYVLLENLGKFFMSRRVYIYQTQSGYFMNSYEWHEEGLEDFLLIFQNIPFESAVHWRDHFFSSDSMYIEDISHVKNYIHDVQDILNNEGLTSAIIIPIFVEKVMIGFMTIENPDRQKAKASLRLLSTLGNFLGNVVKNRKESRERENLYWRRVNDVFQYSKDAALIAKIVLDDNRFEAISGYEKNDYEDISYYHEFMEKMKSSLCFEEDKKVFEENMKKEKLVDIYKTGTGMMEYDFFQKSMLGMDSNRQIHVQMIENPNTFTVEGIIYIKDVTGDYISEKMSRALLSRYCEGAWILDLNQDLVTGIDIVNCNSEGLSFRGSIKDHSRFIAQSMIIEQEREGFLKKSSLTEISQNIQKKEPYVIYATIENESGKLSRRKFTHVFLEKERNVVLCIMEDNSFEYETEMQLTQEIQKEIEEKQKISKEHHFTDTMFKQLLNLQSSGVFVFSENATELVTINQAAMKILDFDSYDECEDFVCKGNPRIKIDDTNSTLKKIKDLTIYSSPVSFECQILHKDGTTVKAFVRTKLVELEQGYRVFISSFIDISEKAKLEQELHEERKQYRDALLHNSLFSYTFDVNTGIVNKISGEKKFLSYIKQSGLKFPMKYDKFIDNWIKERNPQFTDDKTMQSLNCIFLRNLFQQGRTSYEYEYYDQEQNTYLRASVLMSENSINHHINACVIVKNITDMKLKEEATKQALQAAFEAANIANSAKTDFLSRMSHDIRTPMNAIIGMTAIATAHLDDRERVADALEKINSSSKHLLGLINEILDMSKIESGKLELVEEEINLPELIETMLTIVKPLAKAKQHELEVRIQNLKHEKVYGDSLRIQQVFVNIISNAIKYTQENGKIGVTICEKKEMQNKMCCYEFIFEDNGIGMSPEYLEHIFDPFERAKDTRINKIQGTGLGMTITKNIVRLMNGTIHVESKLGKGSKFTVTMYLKVCDHTGIKVDELEGLTVLVADDDQNACESTCDMLDDMGMVGEWVLSGKEAVEKAVERHQKEQDYFAVILDWKMDDMDGVETAKALRKDVGEELPIVVLSAYDWTEIEQDARDTGIHTILSKPLFKSNLIKAFKKILHGGKDEDEAGLKVVTNHDYSGKRALLVEDNELNREIATEILHMTKMDVESAENGQIAVDLFKEAPEGYFDIVLMDVQMPVMNGYDATKAIRALKRDDVKKLPILAMTANAFAEDIQNALDAGMDEHIPKPLELPVLMKALAKWLDGTK